MKHCAALEILMDIQQHMHVLEGALAIVNKANAKRAKNRKRMQIVRAQESVRAQKEEGNGIRDIPPAPPIENKGKEGENMTHTTARAYESEVKIIDHLVEDQPLPTDMPKLEDALLWAKRYPSIYTETLVREWYSEMELWGWKDVKGNPIRNWKGHLYMWVIYRPVRKTSTDPERIPDARKAKTTTITRKQADNWRGTKKENMDNALG